MLSFAERRSLELSPPFAGDLVLMFGTGIAEGIVGGSGEAKGECGIY
jgi:hypothetical protein